MEKIHYCAGSSFLTGDTIAAALTEHARWVTALGRTELVDVPAQRADGSVTRVRVLLSRVTQMSAEWLGDTAAEVEDPGFVADLRLRTALLRTPPTPMAEPVEAATLMAEY